MSKHRWLMPLVTIVAVLGLCIGIIAADDQPLLSEGPRWHWLSAANDGSGGVIVAWLEDTSLYAQRVNASGEKVWDENLLISETCSLFHQSLIEDGRGGAIISWEDDSGIDDDPLFSGYTDPVPFYIRKITADGTLTWDKNPVSAGDRLEIVPDGTGGVIMAWNRFEKQNEVQYQDRLFVQRIDSNGEYLWGNEGMSMVASSRYAILGGTLGRTESPSSRKLPSYTGNHYLTEDGNGGAYLAWADKHSPTEFITYLQHLNSNGESTYKPPVYVTDEEVSRMEYDGNGGVIFTAAGSIRLTGSVIGFQDLLEIRVDADGTAEEEEVDLHLEKLRDSLGNTFLITEGEPTRYGAKPPVIAKYDAGGSAVWEEKTAFPDDGIKHLGPGYLPDDRGGLFALQDTYITSSVSRDIRAGKLDENGKRAWEDEGLPVFDIPGTEYENGVGMVSDGNDGVIIIGILGKTALYGDMVCVQRLDENGERLWGGGICVSR